MVNDEQLMPCELMIDEVDNDNELNRSGTRENVLGSVDEVGTFVDFLTCQDPERPEPKTNSAAVEEFCTCVGFLTCQDPEGYEILDNKIDTLNRSRTLPDPPQPDPPESQTVLVHRTRYDPSETASIYDESTSPIRLDSFDVIVYSQSKQEVYQYNEVADGMQSVTTPTTTSTIGRMKKPEEYEPLIVIVDDDDSSRNDNGLSPKSNRAVRDTSSTSSLQYHRRSPMFLSYASPQHEKQRKRQYRSSVYDMSHHKHRHERFQSILQHEISKRTEVSYRNNKSTPINAEEYSIQFNKYCSTSSNDADYCDDRQTNTGNLDDDRYGYDSPLSLRHGHRKSRKHDERSTMRETDTVCAVAPDKNLPLSDMVNDHDGYDDDEYNRHYHLHHLPTEQIIIYPPSSPTTSSTIP